MSNVSKSPFSNIAPSTEPTSKRLATSKHQFLSCAVDQNLRNIFLPEERLLRAKEALSHRRPDYLVGRVVADHGQQFWLVLEQSMIVAELGSRLYLQDECGTMNPAAAARPVVGDWVAVTPTASEEFANECATSRIEVVLERQSKLSRNAAGKVTAEQILAANVDVIIVVMGLDGDFNLHRLERWLVAAQQSGAGVMLLLSKCDLCADVKTQLQLIAQRIPALSAQAVSVVTGEGIATFAQSLEPAKTYVLAGSSGVGKSSLINALLGGQFMATQAVREHDDRGRHTTTHRQLFCLPNGALLMDGPGIRELQLWADKRTVEDSFDDIRQLAHACRFGDCQHQNEPGCAVQAALKAGQLAEDRLRHWQQLCQEAEAHEIRRNVATRRAYERKQSRHYQNVQAEKRRRKGRH